MSNVKSVKVVRLDSQLEAFGYLASFVFFVITHPFAPVSLLTIGVLAGNAYSIQDYFRSDKAKVEIAKPIGDNRGFSIMSEAIAQEKKPNQIIIDNKLYGYFDPDVTCWKVIGKPTILVHQWSTGATFNVETDALEPARMKSLK